ncbi:MAG TPA: M20/M25/M40 family metallo-hydrolase [Gaiellaceae bacterium]|nr:M20/M25/M40 family metallo-hydrolase [Gaiellaceae bacterium]
MSSVPASLLELLRIPSVSADPAHKGDVANAVQWVADFVAAAGGTGEVLAGTDGPLLVADVPASHDAATAPTVLLYGHVDVQPPAPLDLWETPPFEPTVRGGWLYCRGVADDKGQLWILLEAVRTLAAESALPVNVCIVCDADEEIGGRSAADWLATVDTPADAAVIFDTSMLAPGIPAFNLGARGTAYFHLTVRTGSRDVHSGVFGGAALNATHALVEMLAATVPTNGVLPAELRAGTLSPPAAELAAWRDLPPGQQVLDAQGAVPMDARAAEDFYTRTWGATSLDVNGIEAGSPHLMKTIVVSEAHANVSMRLAPGQKVADVTAALERLRRDAAPDGATVQLDLLSACEPAIVPPDLPAITLALEAFEKTLGVRPVLVRTGGSLPLMPALIARGVPCVLTGFDVPDGNIPAPNERLLVEHLTLGTQTARAVLSAYAGLR